MIKINKNKMKRWTDDWLGFDSPTFVLKWIFGFGKEVHYFDKYNGSHGKWVEEFVDCNTNILKLIISPIKALMFLGVSIVVLIIIAVTFPFVLLNAIEIGNINEEDVDSE